MLVGAELNCQLAKESEKGKIPEKEAADTMTKLNIAAWQQLANGNGKYPAHSCADSFSTKDFQHATLMPDIYPQDIVFYG